jgi:2Fe-2S ferredoxin
MTTIHVTDRTGLRRTVEAGDGLSVMEALRPLDLGIVGECEGSAACATCHVWVDPAWIDRLTAPSDAEQDMLDCAFDTRATSRLSCQIRLSPDLDGLTLNVPGGG